VIPVEEKTYGKKWVFMLKTIKGNHFDMLLQALSESDYNEWIQAFKDFHEELAKAKKDKLKGYIK